MEAAVTGLTVLIGRSIFYQRSSLKKRSDPEFPWALIEGRAMTPRYLARQAVQMLGLRRTPSKEWLSSNAESLWESRALLDDELSKLLFDETLVLRLTGHRQFYFPRIEFDDLVDIVDESPFHEADLPGNYLGLPLKIFDIRLRNNQFSEPIKIVAYKEFFSSLNSYRQYLIQRNSINVSPISDDIVIDCGACIGDMSMIFAGLVAARGQVHLFDPIPLHARYCRLQASLNPSLAHVLHVNELAVSNRTYVLSGKKNDSDKIAPGGLAIDSFACTSLDDYAKGKIDRVDFIKMDIEGAEMDALEGATNIIREFKPRLAISAYHKPDDLWKIPFKLKSINPGYKLYFGHHSPVMWESVFYAVQH